MNKKRLIIFSTFFTIILMVSFIFISHMYVDKNKMNQDSIDFVREEPQNFDDDLSSFIIEFDNSIYQMPIRVSELLENGWEIEEKYKDIIVVPNDLWNVKFTKNNYDIILSPKNYSNEDVSINDCYITTIHITHESNIPTLQLAYGIQLGMSQDDLEKKIKNVKYDKQEHYLEVIYTLNLRTPDILQYIRMTVDTEKDSIVEVLIYCDPFWQNSRK